MIRTVKRVALYARFSSDNQRSESIDAQVRAMTDYCKRNNYVIIETYVDEAKSATTDRRPAFQQMIADSKKKLFDIVLVHKLDRFARNRYDSAVYKRELKKNGVAVHSVLENLDDSPESIMLEAVLEGISEYYSQNLARETMKGMRENALQCKHTGGVPPLGYDVDPITRKLVINEREAETVKIIFDMYAMGYGYSTILKTLNEKGSLTKRGQPFEKTSLTSILRNPKYRGVYVFNLRESKDAYGRRNSHRYKGSDDVIYIENGCPQIVDSHIFNKVQNRIIENTGKGMRNFAKENYVLSGKVYCKECGRSMSGSSRIAGRNSARYTTYRCPVKRQSCSNHEISRDYLDAYVIHLLEEKLFNSKALSGIMRKIEKKIAKCQQGADTVANEAKQKLEEVKVALNNVADAVAAGLVSDALIERLNALETEKATLETRLITTVSTSFETLPDMQAILVRYAQLKQTPSSPEYKYLIRDYINRIDVGKYTLDISVKTGLDIFADLDTTFTVRRQEVYERGKMLT